VNATAANPDLGPALAALLVELVDGPPGQEAYMLNPGDPGLLRSLAPIPWTTAAAPAKDGGAPIARHVDHVRYGLSLMNRWAAGEPNPFATADWATSWKRNVTSEAEWERLRGDLSDEAHRWIEAVESLGDAAPLDPVAFRGVIASVAHLAYHLGAVRQIDARTRGPRQAERQGSS
jgi:hypothetical protein